MAKKIVKRKPFTADGRPAVEHPDTPLLAQQIAREEPFTPMPPWQGARVSVTVSGLHGDTHAKDHMRPHEALAFIEKHTGYSDRAALARAREHNHVWW